MSIIKLAAPVLLVLGIAQATIPTTAHRNAMDEMKRSQPVAVGEEAPDFTLEDIQGNQVSLSSARGKSATVLVFYRGFWCPFCARQLSELRSLLKADDQVRLLAVS